MSSILIYFIHFAMKAKANYQFYNTVSSCFLLLSDFPSSKTTKFIGEEFVTTVAIDSAPTGKSITFDIFAAATIDCWTVRIVSMFLPHKKGV